MAANGERRDPVGHRTPSQTKKLIRKQQKPKEVAKRMTRNAARQTALRNGTATKGDGTEIDHKKQLHKIPTKVLLTKAGRNRANAPHNKRKTSARANRSRKA